MRTFRLPHSKIDIAPLNLGGNVFGWTLTERDSFTILNAFENKGFQFIDTADSYSRWAPQNKGGESEKIIGKWLRERNNRTQMVIATKVGSDMGQGTCLKADYIIKSCENSLRRLQTDYIDLYYTHFDDLETPVEETLKAYDKLYREGKICNIGVSNLSPERLIESMDYAKQNNLQPYIALQPHYNLVFREQYEKQLLPLAEQYDLAVFPYFALASGFLTGKYRDQNDLQKSIRGAGVAHYLTEKNVALLHELDQIANDHHTEVATIALAWLMHQPKIKAPIASATTLSQLTSLALAAEIVLTADELNRLDQIQAQND